MVRQKFHRQTRNMACLVALTALIGFLLEAAAQPPCYEVRPEPGRGHFVLAIDHSGSLTTDELNQAKAGAIAFVNQLRPGDRAAVVAFGSQVRLMQAMTAHKPELQRAIERIQRGGYTALYDAIAYSVEQLLADRASAGARIVVFFTDGEDTSSRLYTLPTLKSYCRSEAVFVYAIGLGSVNQRVLAELSRPTGGDGRYATSASQLRALYEESLHSYYATYGGGAGVSQGGMAVLSLPGDRPVRINGQPHGRTPLKLEGLAPGSYQVAVEFEHYTWECQAPVTPQARTFFQAQRPEGNELLVIFRPQARVFVDDTYIPGTTIPEPNPAWLRAAAQLQFGLRARIPFLPAGRHRIALKAFPEFDEAMAEMDFDLSGWDAEMTGMVENFFPPFELTITMENQPKVLLVNFVTRTYYEAHRDGTNLRRGRFGAR